MVRQISATTPLLQRPRRTLAVRADRGLRIPQCRSDAADANTGAGRFKRAIQGSARRAGPCQGGR